MRHALCLVLLVALVITTPPAAAQETMPDLTHEQIEAIVREYLIENPDVVIEALREYERRLAGEQAAEAERAMSELSDEIYNDPETPVGGDPDGGIVIVEFFDYRCGYCRRSAPALFALRDETPGVKIIYKEFPILGDASDLAATAALAARNQALYEPFHEALMTVDTDFSRASIMAIAADIGLNTAQLERDMADPAIQGYLDRTYDLARTLGVSGTPAFIVDGALYPGALGKVDFERIIASEGR